MRACVRPWWQFTDFGLLSTLSVVNKSKLVYLAEVLWGARDHLSLGGPSFGGIIIFFFQADKPR